MFASESQVSKKLSKNLTLLFIFYSLVLFIPAFSPNYYSVRYGAEYFVNPFVWFISLTLMIGMSLLSLASRRTHWSCLLLFAVGSYIVLYNSVLIFFGNYFGFVNLGLILCTSPKIYELSNENLEKIFCWGLIVLGLFSVLTLSYGLLGLDISPIVENRYQAIQDQIQTVRTSSSSLFGQKNAAGSAISSAMLLLLNLRLSSPSQKLKLLSFLAFVSAFCTLLMVKSAGGILISIAGFLFFILFKLKSKMLALVLTTLLFTTISVYILSDLTNIQYKISSASVKFGRILALFTYFKEQPSSAFFGDSLVKAASTQTFYTESSFLDFWLNFGVVGTLCFVLIFTASFIHGLVQRFYFGALTLLLLFLLTLIQNSSLMPANAVIIVAVYSRIFLNFSPINTCR